MESFRKNLSENTFKTQLESFRMESFRRNLSRKYFYQNRNLSEWNLSEGIFQTRLFDPTGIFQKESFFEWNLSELFPQNRNLSECNLSEVIF
jgi:hypothetical protein